MIRRIRNSHFIRALLKKFASHNIQLLKYLLFQTNVQTKSASCFDKLLARADVDLSTSALANCLLTQKDLVNNQVIRRIPIIYPEGSKYFVSELAI